ncbi:FHA domain-containing protein [Chloroflexota bacterium]
MRCGFENREGELICQQCSILLAAPITTHHLGAATQVLVKDATTPKTGTILMVSFVVLGKRHDYSVKNGTVILVGRGSTDHIHDVAILDLAQADGRDNGISRKHAMIKIEKDQVFLVDLKSTNGTFLNGRRLAPTVKHLVYPNDILRFGALEVSIKIT